MAEEIDPRTYVLIHDEPLPDGMRRILLEELDFIIDQLQRQDGDRDTAIHEARKGFKRLRAALRLIRKELGETEFQQENALFRDAARQLAPLRDSAVLLETVDKLIVAFPEETAGDVFADIRRRLVARHEDTRRRMLETDDLTLEVSLALYHARSRLAELPLREGDLALLLPGLQRVYGGGKRLMQRAYAAESPAHDLFHEWRKRVKYLWHALQILTPVWPPLLGEMIRELRNISQCLGDAHDLVVLSQVVSGEDYYFYTAPGVGLLRELAARRANELESAAGPIGQRLFAESAPAFTARMGAYVTVWQETGVSPQAPQMQLISARQAAALSGLSVGSIRRQLRLGQLAGEKVGAIWVVQRKLPQPDDSAAIDDSA